MTRRAEKREEHRQRFRELVERDEVTLAPSVHNALTAQVVNRVGEFELMGISGYGVSLSALGRPDAGYITMPEMIENSRNIAATADIPVYADLDTGFGNALNARRTMREAVGNTQLAGAFIEDQVAPKRCGHVAGKRVLPREEAVGKFRAAADVRDEIDEEFVIIARTDARGAAEGSLDEAIARGNAFHEAGADVVFVEGPTTVEEVERVGRGVDAPLMYNPTGVSPMLDAETLSEWGFVMSGCTTNRAAVINLYDHLQAFAEGGVEFEAEFREAHADHPVGDLHQFTGMDRVRELEAEYLPEEEQEKYEGSIGHDGEEYRVDTDD